MNETPYQFAEAGEQNIPASIEVVRLRHREGDLEAAQELCHRIMERDPTNPEVYYQLGILALQREAFGMAHHYFRLAADLDPHPVGTDFCSRQKSDYEEQNRAYSDAFF
jgi:Flp pilus assembly protein TadD